MKCAVCGKEFGVRNTCQHCGADKVTGLGNYSGYDAPNSGASISHNESYQQGDFAQSKIKRVESMICHACGEIIPASSKFCPYCSHRLWVQCPKCGMTYSSQYPVCSECGTNRKEYEELAKTPEGRAELELNKYREKWRKIMAGEWENTPEGKAEMRMRQNKENQTNSESGCFSVLVLIFGVFITILGALVAE